MGIDKIKKIIDFYLTRYKLRKGNRISVYFKHSNEITLWTLTHRCDAIKRENEIKYKYPLDIVLDSGITGGDYIKKTQTTIVRLWLKK